MGIAEEKMLEAPEVVLVKGSVVASTSGTDGATVVVVETEGLLAVCDVVLGPAVAEKNVDALSGRLGVLSGLIGPIEGDGVSRLTRGAIRTVLLMDPVSDCAGRSTCPRDVAGRERAYVEEGVRLYISGVLVTAARPEVVDVARIRLLACPVDALSLWVSWPLCCPELYREKLSGGM
jgi:hypothetical protein